MIRCIAIGILGLWVNCFAQCSLLDATGFSGCGSCCCEHEPAENAPSQERQETCAFSLLGKVPLTSRVIVAEFLTLDDLTPPVFALPSSDIRDTNWMAAQGTCCEQTLYLRLLLAGQGHPVRGPTA